MHSTSSEYTLRCTALIMTYSAFVNSAVVKPFLQKCQPAHTESSVCLRKLRATCSSRATALVSRKGSKRVVSNCCPETLVKKAETSGWSSASDVGSIRSKCVSSGDELSDSSKNFGPVSQLVPCSWLEGTDLEAWSAGLSSVGTYLHWLGWLDCLIRCTRLLTYT